MYDVMATVSLYFCFFFQLDFTENPVDPTSQKFSSPRRSLDLSYVSDQVQQKV